jgi:hypothetical protein
MPDDLLFYPDDLRARLEAAKRNMLQAVERYDGNRLLNSDEDQLVAYFVDVGSVSPLTIRDSGITAAQEEAEYDVRHRFDYAVADTSRPQLVPATRVTLHIPFDGEAALLRCTPSTRTFNPPRGRVHGNELILGFVAPQSEAGGAKKHLDEELRKVRQFVGWINNDVNQHNAALEAPARQAVRDRKRRLLENQSLVASLGYPLKAKPDAPQTYSVPEVRRKAIPTPPQASSAPFVPEPALSDALYEQILQVMGNMVRVMEQSPDAFADMKEEDLRTHFLVQLNGQFEGRASAETFRGSGSTDILLVEQDRSVFLAECKFWRGPASLAAAIDQLLDYATWRDAKAALLIFSRNKEFSAVVEAVPGILRDHPQHSGEVRQLSETVFRSRIKQRDDPSRLLTVTTLVYNVPAERSRSGRLAKRRRKDGS